MMNSFRPLARSFRSIKPSPATSISRSNLRFASSSSSTTPLRSTSKDSLYVIGAFTAVTLLFSTIASSVHLRLDSPRSIDPTLENNDQDPPSAFLHATGGKIKDFVGPVFSRDQVTCVMVIGSPLSGKTEQVRRIANRFDFQVEEADSDIYSDIALNLPTAHLSNPHGSSQLRVVVDDFAITSPNPLEQALQFEKDVAPILLFIFVDCPLEEAKKRAKPGEAAQVEQAFKDWEQRMTPLIKHYRDKANFLEITGQWPADEQWEQVYAKLESALELESRGEL